VASPAHDDRTGAEPAGLGEDRRGSRLVDNAHLDIRPASGQATPCVRGDPDGIAFDRIDDMSDDPGGHVAAAGNDAVGARSAGPRECQRGRNGGARVG
jgi:hypothetical protein